MREVEDEVMKDADKEVRETAQLLDFERLNFGLVRVVYEWARAKVIKQAKSAANLRIVNLELLFSSAAIC